MITYGYDNFSHRNARGHMTTSTIWFESRDEILLVTSWTQIMMQSSLLQITLI